MARVLITGANGFIGTNLVKELLSDPAIIIRAMIQPNTPIDVLEQFRQKHGKDKIEIVYADLMDVSNLEQAVKDVDQIVHLAAIVTDWASKEKYWNVIVDGTSNILKVAAKYPIKRFIYMSSVAVHEFGNHVCDDENTTRNMKTFHYGVAKIKAEDLVAQWATENKREYALMRPGYNIFGPYDRGSFVNVIDAIVKNQFGFVNKGKAIISYIYVENLAYGIHLLINATATSGAYIISDGNLTWHEFVKGWCEEAHCQIPKLTTPYWLAMGVATILEGVYKLARSKRPPPLNQYRIRIAGTNLGYSCSKIEKELQYKPPIDFKEGIKRSLSWYYELYPKQNQK